jgi:p-aminobenzoyl-glutamate transporter AbgT
MTFQEIGIFLLILVAWFVLNRWVLPRFGVST